MARNTCVALASLAALAAANPLTSLQQALKELYPSPETWPASDPNPGPNRLKTFLANAKARLEQMSVDAHEELLRSGKMHVKTTQPSVYDTLSHSYFPDNSDGFYAVLPEYLTSAIPSAGATAWSSTCLNSNTATAVWNADKSAVTFNITSSNLNASAPLCTDMYLLATIDYANIVTVTSAGSQAFTVPVPRATWVGRQGVGIFRFLHDPLTTIGDALATVSLFIPSLTEATLDPGSQAANLKFLQDYLNKTMEPRPVNMIDMDWSIVQSGDLFAIHRLDGLGTMEQWGTGADTTHITVALRLGTNQDLYIVESTAKDAYWPLDNIQMNEINTWLPMANASLYAVVHLPLSDAARAVFNQTGAENFIFNSLGNKYGYHNFIMTFFDTENGNLPWPASWQFIEIAFNWLESGDRATTDLLMGLALNKRLGTTNLTLSECSNMAATQNMTVAQLIAIPEQDNWVYPDGPSEVCDVFYCSVMKHAGVISGLFGLADDAYECTEFHNLDVVRMNIFNMSATRPAACVAADPDLPYCQVMGQYRIHLGGVNTYTPYANMNQNCTALPLEYTRIPFYC